MLVFFPFFLFLKKGRYNIFHRQSLWFDLILQISSWRGCSHAQLLDPPQTLGWEISRAPGHLILPHSHLLTRTLMKILKKLSSLLMCPSWECFQKAVLPVVIYFGELYLPCICWEFPSLTKYKKESWARMRGRWGWHESPESITT